jgi:hypothetical protein
MLFQTLTASDLELEQLLCIIRDITFIGYDVKKRKSLVLINGMERIISLVDDSDWLLRESRRLGVKISQERISGERNTYRHFVSVRPPFAPGTFSHHHELQYDTVQFETCSSNKALALGIAVGRLGLEADLKQLKWGKRREMPHSPSLSLA